MNNYIFEFRKELQNLGYSKNAVNNYPKYVQNLLTYSQENPIKINTEHLIKYHEYLQTKIHQKLPKTISESYIYCQLIGIKLYFEYLEKTEIITKNPYHLKLKQPTKNERKIFTQEEIKILYKTCKTTEETLILHLCYGCGLRRNEVNLLEIKDINCSEKLLFVRSGKGNKRRVVPLTEKINLDIYNYITDNKALNKQYLLPFKGNSIYRNFKNIVKRTKTLNPKEFCLHSLRHSIATHLLENEMNVEMVRDFLGHSQLGTTQIYTRINKIIMKNE